MAKKTGMGEDYVAPEDDWDLPVEVRLAAVAEKRRRDAGGGAGRSAAVKARAGGASARRAAASSKRGCEGAAAKSQIASGPDVQGQGRLHAGPAMALPYRNMLDHFPAFAARSGLFQAGRGGGPRLPETVKSPKRYGLEFEGEALTMRDKAIWEACIQIGKGADDAAGDLKVSLSDIGRRIGSPNDGGRALDSIWASLGRLALANVSVDLGPFGRASGRLIADARRERGACWIRLDVGFLARILSQDTQFKMAPSRRGGLGTILGQWLHDYLSTHGAAYEDGFDLKYLRELSGHPCAPRRFPAALRSALSELALAAPELVAGFTIRRETLKGDDWKLDIARGPEMPSFELPKLPAAPTKAKGAKRGGVEL